MKKTILGMIIDMLIIAAGVTAWITLMFIDWKIGLCVFLMMWGDKVADRINRS